ncbi:sensor histidine kinase [Ramlibacter sp. PS4R-6]|uniref:sensor histidine kinase n=1 Tax=Ramlibacter sp. PS4R-6 TaxID=3133438 RepID=UPI00309A54C2
MMKMHGGAIAHPHPPSHAHGHGHTAWHARVFPHGRMCSLRRALLLWLVPLFLVVGFASAAFSYFSHGRMVNEFMDTQMEQLGQSLSGHEGDLMPPPLSAERIEKWGMYIVQVWDKDGTLAKSTWPQLQAPLQAGSGFSNVMADGKDWRVYTTVASGTGKRVQVLQCGVFRKHLAVEQAVASLAPVLILLPLAIFVLWGVARAVSLAVTDIGRKAETQDFNTITELPLDRVPHEIQPLVISFNGLLTRLRNAFDAKRRFVQDAAHELRTPLTALSLQLENLRREIPAESCQQSFAQLEGGVQRATRLVDQMLKMTRQEADAAEARRDMDLNAQVRESIGALIALADQRGIDLGVAGGGAASAPWHCSPGDLRSVIDNLIENALRYTPEGGVVDVHVSCIDGKPAIEVIDTGPGIPPEMMERVFDRFFRVPGSDVRGSGLGLAIARAAAERCGLRIVLRNRTDRSGLVARIEAA